MNHSGPGNFEEQLKKAAVPLSIEEFQKAASNCPVFDTRPEVEGGLIKGSLWVSSKGPITTWVSMICKPEDSFVLVVEEGKSEEVISRLIRIGYFNVHGFNNFKVADYPGEKNRPKIYDGKQILDVEGRVHLDVRNPPEWESSGVIENSVLIPLGQLKGRTEELKGKNTIVVNCRTGLRARFGYSILANAGIDSVVMADSNHEC